MEIKIIDVATTYPLRIEILRNGKAKDFHFVGDEDKKSFHIGAFIQDECVGIASCMQKTNASFVLDNSYQLRGMAVKKDLQENGIGKEIVRKTLEVLKERNCSLVWCNAREKATGFYENLGFLKVGERFQIPKVGFHFVMYKEI